MTTSKTTFGYVHARWSPGIGVQCTTLLILIASDQNGGDDETVCQLNDSVTLQRNVYKTVYLAFIDLIA
jgi:hypothetical protein